MATLLTKVLRSATSATPLTTLPAVSIKKASRGSLGSYVIGAPPQYGQPRPDAGGTSIAGLISPERMREIVMRTPTAGACMNAILDFASAVPIQIRNVDASQPVPPRRLKQLHDYLVRPNPNDTDLHFKIQVYRDMITMGWAAVEIEEDADGNVANLWPLDSAKLFIDFDEHGTVLGYDMLDVRGVPITKGDGTHAWTPEEVILFRLNPVSWSRYPTSRIQQLFILGVIEDMMMSFIGEKFTSSNIPYGVMDLGDLTKDELSYAINSWNTQAKKQHRILLTGSKGGAKYYAFGYALKDLEAKDLLATVRGQIMALLGVTMNELGESQDVNKSNGYNLSYTFKRRALEPLLNEYCTTLSRRLVFETLHYQDCLLGYDEIDSRDELLQAQIDETYQKAGVYSINQLRNRKGLPSEDGGDIPMVFVGTGWIPVHMLEDFAQMQLLDLQAVYQETMALIAQSQQAADGTGAGAPSKLPGLVTTPLSRPPQPPGGEHTPLGSGRSSAKVKFPQPQALTANKRTPQKPRGNVQTARNAGMRKEDMQ